MVIDGLQFEEKRKENFRKKYLLDDETIKEILQDKFFYDTVAAACKSAQQPIAVIVGGQPGSGKTGVIVKSIDNLRKTGNSCFIVDNDNYRLVHPALEEINEECPEYFTECTDQLSFAMTPRMIERGIANRYNMIIHQTLKNETIIRCAITDLMKAGYCVIVRALAVSDLNSNLSMIERCQKDILGKNRMGRWVPQENHDFAYKGLPDTIAKIEESGKYHMIEVLMREDGDSLNPTNIYRKINPDHTYEMWQTLNEIHINTRNLLRYPNAKTAVIEGRKLDLCDTMAKFDEKIAEIEKKATTAEEFKRIKEQRDVYAELMDLREKGQIG